MSQQLYTTKELAEMSPEELRVAQANGFVKPESAIEANIQVNEAMANPTLPSPPQDPYAVTAWGSNEYDFRVPSGQLCRMKKLRPEELIGTDILDRITRLPGYADDLVRKSEGQPPTAQAMPKGEEVSTIIEVMDQLIPMVVVKPVVHRVPKPGSDGAVKDRVEGWVYTDDIELADRVAIMERAMSGVVKMDNFRQEP